ncbi:helix-turn-helix domain-containing protein [Enterococcus faecalis]
MIHFQHYLYRHIGKRIRKYRIASGKNSIEKFANNMNDTYALPIDRVLLSNIENGKAIPGKNKYLFSQNLLDGFCTVLKTTREQLIFGDIDQKEQLIKLILLSLLMNGDKVADDTAIDDDNKALIPFIETGDSIEHYMTNDRHYILD